jgi:hypothetical protein
MNLKDKAITPSIRNKPVFKPQTNREVYMEDVRRIKQALMQELHKCGIEISSEKDEDQFYANLGLFLEESFNWPDYKNYN